MKNHLIQLYRKWAVFINFACACLIGIAVIWVFTPQNGSQLSKKSPIAPVVKKNLPPKINISTPAGYKKEAVLIKPGTFYMGVYRPFIFKYDMSALGGTPKHKVTITKPYYMSVFRTTVEEYCEFLNAVGSEKAKEYITLCSAARIDLKDGVYSPKPNVARAEVNTVPWSGADAYCKWLAQKTGMKIRLPTEAEWEFAARGKEGRLRAWKGKLPKSQPYYDDQSAKVKDWHKGGGSPVDTYSIANITPEGIVGMAGTIGEWVSDYDSEYPSSHQIDPTGPTEGTYKVLRRSIPSVVARGCGWDAKDGVGIYSFRVVIEPNK